MNQTQTIVALGVKPQSASRGVYAGKKSTWALSHATRTSPSAGWFRWPTCTAADAPSSASLPIQSWLWSSDRSRSMNRPAAGFATRRPEEPCANSASTVLWEPGRATAPATRQASREAGHLTASDGAATHLSGRVWPWILLDVLIRRRTPVSAGRAASAGPEGEARRGRRAAGSGAAAAARSAAT